MLERPRRNRKSAIVRALVRETHLLPQQLVLPLFLVEGSGVQQEVPSLPGTFRWSLDSVLMEIESCLALGIRSFVLFPAIAEVNKDRAASYSYAEENFYLHTLRSIKEHFPETFLITDVAMDPYSSDGHDGLVEGDEIVNDPTLPILAKMAIAQAQTGADCLGPSDMMDGRVGFIRRALDQHGFSDVSILSYTAKYASAFYGPFRDALGSAPKKGDKKTYQMDPANRSEARREAALDVAEGADMLMVKPALHYLDIISDLNATQDLPIAAYHVSGECAMLLAACRNGWLDYNRAMPEALTSIRRAGADIILTYLAKDFVRWQREQL